MSEDLQTLLNHAFATNSVLYLGSDFARVIDPVDARRRLLNCPSPYYSIKTRICGDKKAILEKIPEEYLSAIGEFLSFEIEYLADLTIAFLDMRARRQAGVFDLAMKKEGTIKRTPRKSGKTTQQYFSDRFADAAAKGKLVDVSAMEIVDGAVTGTKVVEAPGDKTKKTWFRTKALPQLTAGYVNSDSTQIAKGKKVFENFMYVLDVFGGRESIPEYDEFVKFGVANHFLSYQ